jgi:D-alanyl-D-alanine dipeptidase
MKVKAGLIGCVVLLSCTFNKEEQKNNAAVLGNKHVQVKQVHHKPIQAATGLSDSILRKGLVDVNKMNNAIVFDIKYATTDNFTKQQLYFKINRAYLQKDVADKLNKAQQVLTSLHSDYHLLIYDAIRPREVQYRMWNALDSIPVNERTKFVSNPKNGSIHNYGAAVDLTICDASGVPLDMGAGYDDIRKIAYPSLEKKFLASGELKPIHIENRKLLRKVMSAGGFTNIETEWWHFNACSRDQAKLKYKIVETEKDVFAN